MCSEKSGVRAKNRIFRFEHPVRGERNVAKKGNAKSRMLDRNETDDIKEQTIFPVRTERISSLEMTSQPGEPIGRQKQPPVRLGTEIIIVLFDFFFLVLDQEFCPRTEKKVGL
ncbi:hypothetical protein NPIL_23591 [Nephila pilipes]|uniref:Uncharacterized protein n=1 Tax=Nephila pilipes TaxID=299642 RepID=A0A8X6N1S1_NEPPI|nr:hypothetical protein NPIL_23591 [Nephila pilipes]